MCTEIPSDWLALSLKMTPREALLSRSIWIRVLPWWEGAVGTGASLGFRMSRQHLQGPPLLAPWLLLSQASQGHTDNSPCLPVPRVPLSRPHLSMANIYWAPIVRQQHAPNTSPQAPHAFAPAPSIPATLLLLTPQGWFLLSFHKPSAHGPVCLLSSPAQKGLSCS